MFDERTMWHPQSATTDPIASRTTTTPAPPTTLTTTAEIHLKDDSGAYIFSFLSVNDGHRVRRYTSAHRRTDWGIYCSGLDVGVPKYCDLLLRAAPYLTAYHTQSRERQPSSSVPTTLRESGKPVRRRRSSAVPVKLLYNRQALPGE